jgi:hypothetical protein
MALRQPVGMQAYHRDREVVARYLRGLIQAMELVPGSNPWIWIVLSEVA